ncbi:MAG TPA: crossover junction endodeoxyribonuclease RuvC [Kiritimatiellia bacterium]|nr:crossover junction endodeoxyribonuclease RuvC [Kiritimatiellia bacterium]
MPTETGKHADLLVLGVDTSLRSSGVGLVRGPVRNPQFITCGTIKTPASQPHTECLRRLDAGISELIEEHNPDVVAIEGIFFCKNVRTAMILGQARGVVLAAAARAGKPVYEYAPRDVKKSLSGFGAASKDQVAKMITSLLKLNRVPQEDAADALAIALCHLHRVTGVRVTEPKAL